MAVSAIYGLTVAFGGRIADIASTTVGVSIAIKDGNGQDIVGEIVGALDGGPGDTLISTAIKSPDGPKVGDIIDLASAIAGVVPGLQPLSVLLTVGGIAYSIYEYNNRTSPIVVSQSRSLFQDAQFTSPLILDLDSNGVVATTGLGTGTFFDHDGNGLAESTGWVGSGDALLVRDLNGNGRIDDGNELFGNQTDLANGSNAANGFAALSTLDTNGDGQVNAQDGSGWSSLRLWKDLNGNGISEAGELISLADAGISSLGTAYSSNANPTDTQGNEHRQLGSFTRADGSTGAMHDVWFAADPVIQRDANPVAVNETIAALPDMQGLGNVHSLRQAMALDTTGQLQALVQAFVAGDGSGGPGTLAQAEAVLQAWTGANQTSGMRGTVDARRLAALESLMADTYYNVNWNRANPELPVQTAQINQAYEALLGDLYDKLLAQSHFKPLFDSVGLVFTENGPISLDIQATRALLQDRYATSPAGTEMLIALWGQSLMNQGDFGRQVFDALVATGSAAGNGFEQALASMGFTRVTGSEAADVLTAATGALPSLMSGGSGNDQLTGAAGADVLEGGAGADLLDGGLGNDILAGGAGDDVLRGGQGDDTYVFARGDGADIVIDFQADLHSYDHALGGSDKLLVKGGILASQTQAFRESNDLVLEFGAGDSVRIVGHYAQGSPGGNAGWLERLVFEDGTEWTDWSSSKVTERAYVQAGSVGADALTGWTGMDIIYGGAGNDVINGMGGQDELYGEEGDDIIFGQGVLDGGAGNDTLTGGGLLMGGAGNDNLTANANGSVVDGGDGNDTIHASAVGTYRGGSGDDIITTDVRGWLYGNTFEGGTGNDTITGSYARDTYLFQLGDGHDTIIDDVSVYGSGHNYPDNSDYQDELRFGNGIQASDLQLSRSGDDLLLAHLNGADSVRITNFFINAGRNWIEKVTFEDGTVWRASDLQATYSAEGVDLAGSGVMVGTPVADILTATGYGASLQGGAGDDTLKVQFGGPIWDITFNGGQGNDQLVGSYARDTYIFNRGDGRDTISDDVRVYPGTSASRYFESNPDSADFQDRLQFGSTLAADQLWFEQVGDDLSVSVIGSTDGVTITGWYTSMHREIEEFRLADGRMLLNEDVNQLVQAMAAFSPPPAGQTTLPTDYQSALSGVIAANWR